MERHSRETGHEMGGRQGEMSGSGSMRGDMEQGEEGGKESSGRGLSSSREENEYAGPSDLKNKPRGRD